MKNEVYTLKTIFINRYKHMHLFSAFFFNVFKGLALRIKRTGLKPPNEIVRQVHVLIAFSDSAFKP